MAQRQCDVLTFFRQRPGDALRDFIDFVGDKIADRRNIVREVKVNAGNRIAYLLGLVDEGFPLIGQLGQQIADADLIVIVGALERRDLVVHQSFKFRGAGERAFDAVAHGSDLSANGLSDRDYGLARDRLRLCKSHCDFGH